MPVCAKPDARFQALHVGKMRDPVRVHDAKHYLRTELLEQRIAHRLALFVENPHQMIANVFGKHIGILIAFDFACVVALFSRHRLDPRVDRPEIPIVRRNLGRAVLLKQAIDHALHELGHAFADVLAVQDGIALAVDGLALQVHDIIVLEHVFARSKVHRLHLLLSGSNHLRDQRVLQRRIVGDPLPHHHLGHLVDALLTEQTQKVVLEREVEAGLARVSLAPSAAAQLIVDTPRLVTLGADDAQPSEHADGIALAVGDVPCLSVGRVELPFCSRLLVFHTEFLKGGLPKHLIVASEQNVGSAAGHVGGNGDRSKPARLGNDRGLALMFFRVEHLVPDAAFG